MSVVDGGGSTPLCDVHRGEDPVVAMAERLKMAVVGLNFGRYVVDMLTAQPAANLIDLKVVCDLDQSRANAVGKHTGAKACFDLEEVLSDPMIEAVGLFTGPNRRAELLRRIIRAGKHVLTTKPFELDPVAALDVLREAEARGKVIHLNSPSPRLPAELQQIRLWEKRFNLGRPIACHFAVWANYREQADGSWYDNPDLCPIAPIFRLGIYGINDMVRLFGPAQNVNVISSRLFTCRPTPDNAQLTILFKNGAIGTVFASFCVNDGHPYSNSATYNFENGTIYCNVGLPPPGQSGPHRRMSVVARTGENEPTFDHAVLDEASGDYQWNDFVRAVRGQPLTGAVTAEEIVGGIRIINAMAQSARSARIEEVS
jgi:predicted dehydrogenase